jgi:two-component system cell cycle sensor histidine kinase PleC
LHRLLQRQLKKARGGKADGAIDLDTLLGLVDGAYGEFERQHRVLAHTHNVMREEHGQLNARLSRLRDAISQMGAGFSIWDSEDRLVLWNQRMHEILSHVTDDIQQGAVFTELIRRATPFVVSIGGTQDSVEWVAARVARHRNPTGPFEMAFTNGRYVQVWEEKTGEGGIVSLYLDITDRKRAEQELLQTKEAAESANQSKSQFLANMSHELRTPLNAVLGFSEVMMSEIMGPLGDRRYHEYAKDIHDAGSHLLDIISDILDMSKIEAGHFDLDAQWIDVADPVGETLRLIGARARDGGLTISREIEPNLPPLYADLRSVKQILLNLLGNAIKFTPAGGKVTVGARLLPNRGLSLSVSDTGLGIAAEDIPQALKPFGQIERALSRRHGGVGLGLPLSKHLVELHDGTLDIASEPGKGTTVSIYFPPGRVGRAAAVAS